MDEQMNNNGYQSQPNPMPNQNKDGIAIAVFVLGQLCSCYFGSWYSINLLLCSLWYRGIGTACIKHK